jgi:predicted nucleic acid-binding protein
MVHASPSIIVADTSVLVNFLRIDRMDLVAAHAHDFIATDHVAEEITEQYPDQQARYTAALAADTVRQVSVTDPQAVALFVKLVASGRLGAGECSAIALAVHRGHILAIDDRRATNQARQVSRNLHILSTQDLMVAMIREGLLEVDEADAIKELWARAHRFHLKISSFRDLLVP